jgi:hypothetical protein
VARTSRRSFEKLQAIAPGIFGEEAARLGQRIIFGDLGGLGGQGLAEPARSLTAKAA